MDDSASAQIEDILAHPYPLSRTLFSYLLEERKKSGRGRCPGGNRNRVGAACSAYLLLVFHTLSARKPAPLSAITKPFSPLPKKCPGKSVEGRIYLPHRLL